ncbi:MAG: AAA family ATPase [Bacteroidaceae bacterium]|nr:AAA family ATPase [Bacteroidaceae bacterium]
MTINDEMQRAARIVEETGTHLFLTGRAGTGKTTFLRNLCNTLNKRYVILAPTGIAAINAGGSTIHSFFQFSFGPYLPNMALGKEEYKIAKNKIKLIRSLDLIVIDEISMVRADLLDHIDSHLRHYRRVYDVPFGGVQLLMIGDLQQLSPVTKEDEWNLLKTQYDTPYFFSSKALRQTSFVTIELQKVFRQSDSAFLDLLGRVRDNKADTNVLNELNKRYIPDFKPKDSEGYIHLVTHNNIARRINDERLAMLDTKEYVFCANISGTFPETSYPTDEVLRLKRGAQVMFVKNDPDHAYYNGSIGHIVDIDSEGFSVRLQEDEDSVIDVCIERWENSKYVLNERSKAIEELVDGAFEQYPVKLAWAITIHKSQGLTFDRAIIDAHAAFAHGQTYVALSRLRTIEGLVLSSPLPAHAIINDASVEAFTQEVKKTEPTNAQIETLRKHYVVQVLEDLFSFAEIRQHSTALLRLMEEYYGKTMTASVAELKNMLETRILDLETVSKKFYTQYQSLVFSQNAEDAAKLMERIQKAVAYFQEQLQPVQDFVKALNFSSNNKEVQKRTEELFNQAVETINNKMHLLNYVSEEGFILSEYILERSLLRAGITNKKKAKKKQKAEAAKASKDAKASKHPELFDALVRWRLSLSRTAQKPAYTILTQVAVIAISNLCPKTRAELSLIPGIGPAKLQTFGEEILAIVKKYCEK